jgi:outer membrane protein
VIAGLCMAISAVPALGQNEKIGFVDMQRALQQSKQGKKALADLQARKESIQKELEGKKDEVVKLEENLKRRAVVMREEERRKGAEEFERKRFELSLKVKESESQLQAKYEESVGKLVQALHKVVLDVAKQQGYTLILDPSAGPVLYFQKSDDLTEEVLKRFDGKS